MTTDALMIRAAQMRDLDALMRLEHAAFASDRMSRRAMRHAIASAAQCVLVAHSGDPLAGAVIAGFRKGSTVARISSLAVDAAYGGRGIGRALIQAIEHHARRLGATRMRLEVRADNEGAARLYDRAGYTRFGRYDDYYEDGAAALRFEKNLPG
ncbi:MAG: GNAT family N-acetyltransferase [Beijerinckiaceae bacterium]